MLKGMVGQEEEDGFSEFESCRLQSPMGGVSDRVAYLWDSYLLGLSYLVIFMGDMTICLFTSDKTLMTRK